MCCVAPAYSDAICCLKCSCLFSRFAVVGSPSLRRDIIVILFVFCEVIALTTFTADTLPISVRRNGHAHSYPFPCRQLPPVHYRLTCLTDHLLQVFVCFAWSDFVFSRFSFPFHLDPLRAHLSYHGAFILIMSARSSILHVSIERRLSYQARHLLAFDFP